MAINIQELSLETLVDEIVEIHNHNVNLLSNEILNLSELVNVSNGNIDVSDKTVGSIKAKSFISTTGMTIQSGNLSLINGNLALNGTISGNIASITTARINKASELNSGITLKNFTSVTTPGVINVNLSNTILISIGGSYSLNSSVVEVINNSTFSQEIQLIYLGTGNATITGLGLSGAKILTMSQDSSSILRYIGSSWIVLSSVNAVLV